MAAPSPLFEAVRAVPLDPRPSPLFEAVRGTPDNNLALGLDTGKAHPSPGGIAIEVDSALQASRQPILDLMSTPGVSYSVAEDAPNLSNLITVTFDGMRMINSVSLSGTAVANTLLFTVPGGQVLTVELVVVRCVAASGITAPPTAGVGFNGAADNIFASQILTGLTAAGKVYVFPPGGLQAEIPAASAVSFGIDVGAAGGSMTLEVDLIGRSA